MKGIFVKSLITSNTKNFAENKAVQIFTIDEFIGQVKYYHAPARLADFQVEKALADLQAASAFDPSVCAA